MSFIPEPGTQWSQGQEPTIVARLKALSAFLGKPIYGISGYRDPAHSVAVGGSANDPHTRGEAADIGVGAPTRSSAGGLTAAILARFGLYRPFDPSGDPNNPEVNHVQLMPRRGNGITRTPSAAPQTQPGIIRPGGGSANPPSGNASGVKSLLQGYTSLRDMPRTAPPGTKNPTKWFLASFTGQWDQFAASGQSNPLGSGGAPVGGSGVGAFGGAPDVVGAVTKAMLVRVGAMHGWSGTQLDDWMRLIQKESGGDPKVLNKSTGAAGVGQMLAPGGSYANPAANWAKYRAYGGDPSTVIGQLTGMAGYITQRYGDPSAAWAHEVSNNWY